MRRFDVFFLGTIEAIVVMDVYVYIKAGDIKWGYNTYIYIYIMLMGIQWGFFVKIQCGIEFLDK